MTRVSCILCTNRDDGYLRDTINSVLFQTYRDFELIIVANNCPVTIFNLLENFEDERIHIIKSDLECIGYARNLGVDQAKGELILMIDSDDICYPSRFEEQVDYMDSHPEIIVASSWAKIIDSNGAVTGELRPKIPKNFNWFGIWKNPIINPAVIFRKSAWKKYKGYPGLISSEDFGFWLVLAANGEKGISIIQRPLIKYRIHGNQTFRKRGPYMEASLFHLKLFLQGYGTKYLIGFFIHLGKMMILGR